MTRRRMVLAIVVTAALVIAVVAGVFAERVRTALLPRLGPITDVEATVSRPRDGVSVLRVEMRRRWCPFEFSLYAVALDPDRHVIGATTGNEWVAPEGDDPGAPILVVNGGYFDADGRPVMYLRDRERTLGRRASTTSAFFWQRRGGKVGITHSSRSHGRDDIEFVIQSMPRLIGDGHDTKGLRDLNTIDARAGLGVLVDGRFVVYATDNVPWAGLSCAEIRALMREHFELDSLLCLDGGGSVHFAFSADGMEYQVRGWREVPVVLAVTRR